MARGLQLAIFATIICWLAVSVYATHFRYGYCAWENNVGSNLRTVRIRCRSAWRLDTTNPSRKCGGASINGGYGDNECPCINVDWRGNLYSNAFDAGPNLCDLCTGAAPSNCVTATNKWVQVTPVQRTDPAVGGQPVTYYTEWTVEHLYTYPGTEKCFTIGYYAGGRLTTDESLQNGAGNKFLIHSSVSLSSPSVSPLVLSGDPLVKQLPRRADAQYRIRLAPFTPNADGHGFRCHHDPTQETLSGDGTVLRASIGSVQPIVTDDCVIKWDTSGGAVGNRYVIRVHAHQEPNFNYDGDPNTEPIACEVAVGFDFLFTLTDISSDTRCNAVTASTYQFPVDDLGGTTCADDGTPLCCSTDGRCCQNAGEADHHCGQARIDFRVHNDQLCNDVVFEITHPTGSGTFETFPSTTTPRKTGVCNVANDGEIIQVLYTPPVGNENQVAGATLDGTLTIEDIIYGIQAQCSWSFIVPVLETGTPDIALFARHKMDPYTNIINGDTSPTEGEGTDLGGVRISHVPSMGTTRPTQDVELVIVNTGEGELNIRDINLLSYVVLGSSCGNTVCLGNDWWIDENDVGLCGSTTGAPSAISTATCETTGPEGCTGLAELADPTPPYCVVPTPDACAIAGAPVFPADPDSNCNTLRLKLKAQAQEFGLRQVQLEVVSDDADEMRFTVVLNLVGIDPEIDVQDLSLTQRIPDDDTNPYPLESLPEIVANFNGVFHVGFTYDLTIYVVNEYRAMPLQLIPSAALFDADVPSNDVTVYDNSNPGTPQLLSQGGDIRVLAYPAGTGQNKVDVHVGAHAAPLYFQYTPGAIGAKTFFWRVDSDDTLRPNEYTGGNPPAVVEGYGLASYPGGAQSLNGYAITLGADPIDPRRALLAPTGAPDDTSPIPCETPASKTFLTRFPAQLRGGAEVSQTFRIDNIGTSNLIVQSVVLNDNSIFYLPTAFTSTTIAPADPAVNLVINMRTAVAGVVTANITVTDNTYERTCIYMLEGFIGYFDITEPTASSICYMYMACPVTFATNVDSNHMVQFNIHSRYGLADTSDPEYLDRMVWTGAAVSGTAVFRGFRMYPRMYHINSILSAYTGPADGDDFSGTTPASTADFRMWASQECRFGGGC